MKIYQQAASKDLQPYIREFYFLSVDHTIEKGYRPIVDDGCHDFIFFKEQNSQLRFGANQQVLPIDFPCFTVHQLKPPYELFFGETLSFFTIKVQPWLNASFFPIQDQNGIVDISPLYAPQATSLHQKLFQETVFEKQIALASEFLATVIPQLHSPLLIKNICEDIYRVKGSITVNELSESYQIARQELNKLFKAYTYYTLKQFIAIVRITGAIKLKLAKPHLNFTTLSHEMGYFDQAHFNNDFKKVCGLSPKQFFQKPTAFFLRHQ